MESPTNDDITIVIDCEVTIRADGNSQNDQGNTNYSPATPENFSINCLIKLSG